MADAHDERTYRRILALRAVRHGAARSVRVALAGRLDGLHLTVADDGHGFPFSGRHDQAALGRQGWGPRALRERVTALGGTLVVERHRHRADTDGVGRQHHVLGEAADVEVGAAREKDQRNDQRRGP